MEIIFTLAIIYVAVVIPFKLWQTTGKLEYLQKETDKTIEQLTFNNDYYIEHLNDSRNTIREISEKLEEANATSERYWRLYLVESNNLAIATEFVEELGEDQYNELISLLYPEED